MKYKARHILIVLLAMVPVSAGCGFAGSFDVVDGKQGKLLLLSAQRKVLPMRAARDPFNWPAEMMADYDFMNRETETVFSDFKLSGIIYSPTHPLAIINSTLLGEGDLVDEAYVVAIEPDKVLLQKGEHQYVMEFEEMIIEMAEETVSSKKGSLDDGQK